MARQRWDEINARRAERFSGYGRDLENRVEKHLQRLQETGRILGFTRHRPHSHEDNSGSDFTLTRLDGTVVDFGVTVSSQSHQKAKLKHAPVQLWFPLNTKPDTIEQTLAKL